MAEPRLPESLIQSLGDQLTPVRRLPPPWVRTLGWLVVVAVIAALPYLYEISLRRFAKRHQNVIDNGQLKAW